MHCNPPYLFMDQDVYTALTQEGHQEYLSILLAYGGDVDKSAEVRAVS